MRDQKDLVRAHYGQWASTYGDAADDGLFAWVRGRESRLVHRLLELPLRRATVLDAGCGSGLYSNALQANGHEVCAVDFAPEMVERVRGRVAHSELADVEELALGRRFERVLCIGVLEWVKSPARALSRLAAHLAPGGRLVVLAPRAGPGGWIYLHQKRKHGLEPRLCTPRMMRRLGEQAGLRYRKHLTPFFHNFVMAFDALQP